LTFQNNIALIKLKYEVNFDKEMQPACLPEDSFEHHLEPHRIAYSVGYGTANRMFFRRFSLSNALINIMHHSLCHNIDIHRTKDWTKQFCAGEFDEFNNKTNYCMGENIKLYIVYSLNVQIIFFTIIKVTLVQLCTCLMCSTINSSLSLPVF